MTVLSGFQMLPRASTVRQSTKSLLGLTITERPSTATRSSRYSMPLSAAACASESLMGREALLMTVSPTVNLLKPPPVPETPTLTRTLEWILLNSSATASVMGKTVLEPSISNVPESSGAVVAVVPVSSSFPPHATTSSAPSTDAATTTNVARRLIRLQCSTVFI